MKRKDNGYKVEKLSKDLNFVALDNLTDAILENDEGWKKEYDKNGMIFFTKKNVFGKITSIRYRTKLNQSLEVVNDFAYERMLHFMPSWSKEFIGGEILRKDENVKLLKTQFKTPFFMKNRSYVFNLYRIKKINSFKVIYESVYEEGTEQVDKGFVRSKLFPTVYNFTEISDKEIQMEHILSTDLGHDLPLWFQNASPVVQGVVKANVRDCMSIKNVLENKF